MGVYAAYADSCDDQGEPLTSGVRSSAWREPPTAQEIAPSGLALVATAPPG